MASDESRRTLLAGGLAAVASSAAAAAPPGPSINDPDVVREVAAEFAGYDAALGRNDVAALTGYFFDSPLTVRFGIAENLFGAAEIAAYRSTVAATGAPPHRERTVITTFGRDFATVATLSQPSRPEKVTRTMQSWVRFPQGWRIVAAHVSSIDRPAQP